MEVRNVADIRIGTRHRKDLGNIDALAASIDDVGLLHPVVITPSGLLIAGERRLAAIKRLGWEEIPVNVAHNLADAAQMLRAERDENMARKDFTPSEAVEIARELEPLERELARERMIFAHTSPENFTELESGNALDKTAAAVGMSRPTLVKAREIVEAAEREPELFADVRERMDRTGNISGAYKELKKRESITELESQPPPLPTGPFDVIVIDPPWAYDNRASDISHRARNPYGDMGIDEICALPVTSMAADNCIVWLWTTNAHMRHAYRVLDAWGFEEKTILTWAKDRMGTGDWLRGQTEHCILAIRGKPVVNLTNQTTLLRGPLREHSRKPDEFYEMVEALCPGYKVELFARQQRAGWTQHGSELGKFNGRNHL